MERAEIVAHRRIVLIHIFDVDGKYPVHSTFTDTVLSAKTICRKRKIPAERIDVVQCDCVRTKHVDVHNEGENLNAPAKRKIA